MQAQKRELREKEKELAEALVVLAGEVAFTDLSESLQTSLSTNPLIQIRHLCAGLSRQLSKIELQMADNAPYCRGKNLYTGGEIARKFLPPIQLLFNQRPVPQRMIFELLMEVKDSVYAGMADCAPEVLEWELNNFTTFEELDELIVRALLPPPPSQRKQRRDVSPSPSTLLEDSHPGKETKHQGDEDITPNTSRPRRRLLLTPLTPTLSPAPQTSWLLSDPDEALYALESLEATSAAMLALPVPTSDFLAKSILTLRRLLPRRTLADAAARRKKRKGRCGEYARCMKWAGAQWRAEGGCGRGCRDEDEVGEEGLPSWHRGSRHFEKVGEFVLTGG
ncbi:hypothetical protein BU24DRAFT_422994 [Aaosphaeria arxii CBS 175.79]|uniref:Uncharacterized protein n=1 Tax=Aaosphaeria arxii CBS 175.79 TaxID=1450172 RepID=A0A6A5XUL3_9PLEO|nr:uncharacterized protein BU24DRAFT_422994 [Aaosphaeria arxii CBS 175.79]KAF2016616.1 hypothetical protein BU24DRAFT_422994 [Aaosphaeria arxii CBS 175.79]